jgi:hypothetical protein
LGAVRNLPPGEVIVDYPLRPELTRPVLTINGAAAATGRHRNTIRRALDSGKKFPNAYRHEGSGPWLIPVADLVAAGYALSPPEPHEPPTGEAVAEVRRLEREVAELHERIAEIARRADVAEALASERAERIEDLREAMPKLGTEAPGADQR